MESIEKLLRQPEGKTLEFKRDLSSPGPTTRTLVAFANTAGGRLVIGYENQQVVGVEDPFLEEERVCNLIADSISPRLVPEVDLYTVDNKTILVVQVFVSGGRPHWVKTKGPEQGVYIRLAEKDSSTQAQ